MKRTKKTRRKQKRMTSSQAPPAYDIILPNGIHATCCQTNSDARLFPDGETTKYQARFMKLGWLMKILSMPHSDSMSIVSLISRLLLSLQCLRANSLYDIYTILCILLCNSHHIFSVLLPACIPCLQYALTASPPPPRLGV